MSEATNETRNLKEVVDDINAKLRSFGREAVQEIKMIKNGQVIGQIRYGYKAQYVFDAVNSILLPENWRYEVVSKEIYETQVVAEVKLFLRTGEEWFCKGSQSGQMQIVKKNVGDAMKGSITDALQKCLSLLSIGSDAYKGLLRDVYFSGNRPPSANARPQPQNQQSRQPKPQQNTNQPPSNDTSNDELPKIAGIKYQHRDGIVVATGNSYDKKDLLKSAGFKWDGSGKNWFKEVTVH